MEHASLPAGVRVISATTSAIKFTRSLRCSVEYLACSGDAMHECDLIWRTEAGKRSEAEGLTLEALIRNLPIAIDAMAIVN